MTKTKNYLNNDLISLNTNYIKIVFIKYFKM